MSALGKFLAQIGASDIASVGGCIQFRSVGTEDGGSMADVERIETSDGSAIDVVVSVWEWVQGEDGPSRHRVGRLVFRESTGALTPESDGDPAMVAGCIGGMKRMEG